MFSYFNGRRKSFRICGDAMDHFFAVGFVELFNIGQSRYGFITITKVDCGTFTTKSTGSTNPGKKKKTQYVLSA
jgi:hypothetical protein